jgi:hypothetical protein
MREHDAPSANQHHPEEGKNGEFAQPLGLTGLNKKHSPKYTFR